MRTRRQDESRTQLYLAMMFALGSYMEQEAKKVDQWREQNIGQLYAHLAHATSLAALLLAKALEMTGIVEQPQGEYGPIIPD